MKQSKICEKYENNKKFIKDVVSTKEFKENVRICNTGLLIGKGL
jgi:hypothetical protein